MRVLLVPSLTGVVPVNVPITRGGATGGGGGVAVILMLHVACCPLESLTLAVWFPVVAKLVVKLEEVVPVGALSFSHENGD